MAESHGLQITENWTDHQMQNISIAMCYWHFEQVHWLYVLFKNWHFIANIALLNLTNKAQRFAQLSSNLVNSNTIIDQVEIYQLPELILCNIKECKFSLTTLDVLLILAKSLTNTQTCITAATIQWLTLNPIWMGSQTNIMAWLLHYTNWVMTLEKRKMTTFNICNYPLDGESFNPLFIQSPFLWHVVKMFSHTGTSNRNDRLIICLDHHVTAFIQPDGSHNYCHCIIAISRFQPAFAFTPMPLSINVTQLSCLLIPSNMGW